MTKDYFSPNQTVIDVGFHCDEDGISGNVDKEVADYVKNITPVPGGVGSVTTAVVDKVKNWDGAVLFTRDTHFDNYLETQEDKNLPIPHCIQGTHGWDISLL